MSLYYLHWRRNYPLRRVFFVLYVLSFFSKLGPNLSIVRLFYSFLSFWSNDHIPLCVIFLCPVIRILQCGLESSAAEVKAFLDLQLYSPFHCRDKVTAISDKARLGLIIFSCLGSYCLVIRQIIWWFFFCLQCKLLRCHVENPFVLFTNSVFSTTFRQIHIW